ncbi:MAG: DoxX family protein [bacterium]|nr:DoxX family protein [bacterium]
MKSSSTYHDLALLFLRLVVGAVFLWAGYAKLFIWSAPMEGMTDNMILLIKFLSIVEPLGAVAIIFGFLTRWASAGLAVIMAGSLYFVYFVYHVPIFTGQTSTGMDYNLLLLAGCTTLLAFGAGNWAVDKVLKKS